MALGRVITRRGTWSTAAVARASHDVYAVAGPWLGQARARRDAADSRADQARWDAWVTALTPPERSTRGSYEGVVALVDQAREMLRALLVSLVPGQSVGAVGTEIETLIQAGEITPGVRINRRILARRLQVSVEYVDLALADLSAKGLVEIRATGAAVVTLSTSGSGTTSCGRQRADTHRTSGATAWT
ncbi:GntR family transcriptional regulator [Streptomyces sp. SR27]|uniref:GntR family transcriptional regulator n=1 Tax=Streptomyces sp. SR27 TaxID=3076630 RepID=UPI00295A6CAD|nr:GntR family transcriptional regulator [Streptomyces sp. SR27]MDV9188546.1 GntR family transcriptional regulator [Streptomyces sp. SR27]